MINLVLVENGEDTNGKIKSYFLLFSLLIGFVLCCLHLFLALVLSEEDCNGVLSPGRGGGGGSQHRGRPVVLHREENSNSAECCQGAEQG